MPFGPMWNTLFDNFTSTFPTATEQILSWLLSADHRALSPGLTTMTLKSTSGEAKTGSRPVRNALENAMSTGFC